ncbi:hypothetical protein [Cribrihabitans marinus]|nr:hypothetical protein [Cribrihabitans marinus]
MLETTFSGAEPVRMEASRTLLDFGGGNLLELSGLHDPAMLVESLVLL